MTYGVITVMGEFEVDWFNSLAKATAEFDELEKLGWQPSIVKVIKVGKPQKHIRYRR
jgi:hypothetical protein